MNERLPNLELTDHLDDFHNSSLLSFEADIHVNGDPDQPHEFAAALAFLDLIAEHFLNAGQFWVMLPANISDRLEYLNARHNFEVAQEHGNGEHSAQFRTITVHHLRALSERRLRAMDEMGWSQTWKYRLASFLHVLLERTVAEFEEQHPDEFIAQAMLADRDIEDDVPF